MSVKSTIETRRSIRSYLDKPVENEKLIAVLQAGRLAPSARNLQNWKIIAVTDKAKIALMQDACMGQKQVGMAPVTLAICANNDRIMACGQPTSSVDCSIAMSFMMLAAAEEGLGTCWLGSFDAEKVRSVLNIPQDYVVVAVTPLGYADGEAADRGRKPFDEIVCFDSFK